MIDLITVVFFIDWLLAYFLPLAMILTGAVVFLLETLGQQKAKYGRYNTTNTGVNASLAWFLQETPAFLVPFGFLIFGDYKITDLKSSRINLNLVLLAYFMLHYFHR